MIFVTRWAGIVGSQKARGTVPFQQLAEIGSTGQYVVVRVIWIAAGGGEGACRGMVMSLGSEITTPGSGRSRYGSS